jgi:hypothetical protein
LVEERLDSRLEQLESTVDRMSAALAALTAAVKDRARAPGTVEPQAKGTSPSAVPAPRPPENERTERATQAEQAGEALIEQAVRAGHWTASDRDQLRAILGETDGSGRSRLASLLSDFIASKQLVLDEFQGPPL